MRLIDADYIKIRLCEIADYWRSKGKRYEAVLLNDTVNAVIDSESTITQPSGEWISVEDRLPKTGTIRRREGYMKGCKDCPAYAKCTVTYRGSACAALRGTYGLDNDPEIITNADRIRAMSDEELGKFLCDFRSCNSSEHPCDGCKAEPHCHTGHNGMIDWLRQSAEEG